MHIQASDPGFMTTPHCLHLRHQTFPPQACLHPDPRAAIAPCVPVLQTLDPQSIHKCLNYRNWNHCFSSCVYTPDPRDCIYAHSLEPDSTATPQVFTHLTPVPLPMQMHP